MTKRQLANRAAFAGLSVVVGAAGVLLTLSALDVGGEQSRWVLVAIALLGVAVAGAATTATALANERVRGASVARLLRELDTVQTRVEPVRDIRRMHHEMQLGFEQASLAIEALTPPAGLLPTLESLRADVAAIADVEAAPAGTGARIGPRALERRLEDTSFQLYRQIEARSILERRLGLTEPLPRLRGFAVSPDLALDLVERVLDGGIREVVETGSGVSTLLIALALEQTGSTGRVTALEHHEEYAAETRAMLERFGCAHRARIVEAPLEQIVIGDEPFTWYRPSAIDLEPRSVELLLVDGPPASTGELSRYPAVPLLHHALRPGAVVMLDDARRTDEHRVLERWKAEGLVRSTGFVRHDKGTALFESVDVDAGAVGHVEVARSEHDAAPPMSEPTVAQAESAPSRLIDPDELPDAIWHERYGERSSYVYKLHESKRRRHLLPLLGHRQRVWAYNDKPSGYGLATSLGVSVPETFHRAVTVDELDWNSLPTRFAIKPANGAANRGVFLLVRRQDERFDDLMTGQVLSVDEVVQTYSDFVADGKISPRFAVEELLEPTPNFGDKITIPDDLKVYCFYDQPTVIMQRRMYGEGDRTKWRFKVWDADWKDLGPVKYPDRYESGLEAPVRHEAVLEAASTISSFLAVPFIRLDFFDTSRGVVFGEVSVHPGPPEVWDSATDEWLGKQWEIAEARLLAESISPSEPRPNTAVPPVNGPGAS